MSAVVAGAPVKRGRPPKRPPADAAPLDAPDAASDVLRLSPFQTRVLQLPEECDVFLGGGRGGAKSYTLAVLALRHAEQHGAKARILYIRQSHQGCADFESLCLDLYGRIYGRALRFNGQEGLFRFPSGATLEVNQLEGPQDYSKYQGRSFTLLLVDEAGQYATPDLLDKLRSNLRGPAGMPIRCVLAANPGDVGHQWISARYVFRAAPWVPFMEPKSQRMFVYAPSVFLDNPFIDVDAYRRQLEASCPSDPELLRAWCLGDWTVARGAYFASVLDEARNAVAPWPCIPGAAPVRDKRGESKAGRAAFAAYVDGEIGKRPGGSASSQWQTWLAMDFGSSAPAVVYVVAQSPGATGPDGKWYSRDSLVLVDELATNEPGNLNKGLGWTTPILAEAILEMCKRWHLRPEGVADDAIFAKTGSGSGSIGEEFARAGVRFYPAKKADRIAGWNIMRRLLQDAGKPDVPGLYVARHCEYFWATVPYLGRDPRRVEDLDSRGPDHAADAARYGCLRRNMAMQTVQLGGF